MQQLLQFCQIVDVRSHLSLGNLLRELAFRQWLSATLSHCGRYVVSIIADLAYGSGWCTFASLGMGGCVCLSLGNLLNRPGTSVLSTTHAMREGRWEWGVELCMREGATPVSLDSPDC